MNHYDQTPKILAPGIQTCITKRLYTETGMVEKETKKNIFLHDDVIKYADNDVDVLPILYKCMDELTKKVLNVNITDFITAGSIAWYGFI